MGYRLNNVTTANGYTDANTLECAKAQRGRLVVSNAAIYAKWTIPVGIAPMGESFGNEQFFAPGIYPLPGPTTRIAVRSAATGTPAQVTIDAY